MIDSGSISMVWSPMCGRIAGPMGPSGSTITRPNLKSCPPAPRHPATRWGPACPAPQLDPGSALRRPACRPANRTGLYMLAARRPATRDPVGVWLAALSNETWFQRTAAELAAEQPDLIIGIDQPLYPQPPAQPLLQIPHVGAWISAMYRCDAGA